jgi:hypothetical protein
VPSLATEAETSEELIEKLKILIPELMEANSIQECNTHAEIPFHLVSERDAKASLSKSQPRRG